MNDSIKQRSTVTDSTVPFGAGAIYSTVKDMYQWHLGLQSYKIVEKNLMEKAYTSCALHNYGYGWQIDSVYGKKMERRWYRTAAALPASAVTLQEYRKMIYALCC